MKLLLVILDGAGDVKIKALRYKTPLEAARIKNMDFIAESGKNGVLYPVRKDIAPESDQSLFSILGYDPFKFYTGRGVIEALGAGIKFKEGNVAIRGNFAYLKGDVIKETSVKISYEENKHICDFLNKKLKNKNAEFYPTKGYRFVLILKGDFSDKISNTHPGYEIVENHVSTAVEKRSGTKIKKCVALSKDPKALKTAELINNLVVKAKEILENSDFAANYIILRGAGSKLPKIKKLEKGWCILADSPADIGIGKLAGMDILKKPEDYKALSEKISEALKKYDKALVQIKSPDKLAHRKDFKGKVRALEDIDRNFFGNISPSKNLGVILTSDHCTSSLSGVHVNDPVPLAINFGGKDEVSHFNESACKKGALGEMKGIDLMKILRGMKNV